MLLWTLAPSFPEAQCISPDIDPDFFFPDSKHQMEEVEEALSQICGRCIHKEDCLKFAIEQNESEGYWGGTTPSQRDHLMKQEKQKGSERFREIQGYLNIGMTKMEVAHKLGVQLDSVERILHRAKKKGITL